MSLRAIPNLDGLPPGRRDRDGGMLEAGAEQPTRRPVGAGAVPAESAAAALDAGENRRPAVPIACSAGDGAAQGRPDRHRFRGRNRWSTSPPRWKPQGIGADVVSMPCCRASWPSRILSRGGAARCSDARLRVSIEAGTTLGWERFTGLDGLRIGIDQFGASAPAEELYDHFGLDRPAKITPRVLAANRASPQEVYKWRRLRSTVSGASAAWSRARCSSGPIAGWNWCRSTISPTPSPMRCCSSATACMARSRAASRPMATIWSSTASASR